MIIVHDPSAPLVVVVGATGVQGGSVIRELARSDRPYRIRGLTRNPSKPAAQALAKEGVELYAVNIVVENKDTVYAAFNGGNIAFLVTNYMEHMEKQREVSEGKLMIDAAISGGVQRIIWSGLQSFDEASGGKYANVDIFNGKWEVTLYGRERVRGSNIAFTNVDAGSYTTNYDGGLSGPQPKGDGTFVMKCPIGADVPLPIIDMVHDYGLFVRHAIESPDFAHGGEILTASEMISLGDAARQLSEVTGKTVTYEQEDKQAYIGRLKATGWGSDGRVHAALAETTAAFNDVGYYCGKPAFDTSKLARKTRSRKEYAAERDWSQLLSA